jgi:MarR family transcriptional regulator, 2-MHQ and catechol-resistance regulon repressor
MEKTQGVHVWLVLWKAYTAMERKSELHIHSMGLCLSDFAVLEVLLHKGPLPVNAIGPKVNLTSGSITTAVDRLENKGLVERHEDKADRRTRVVHLTAAGRDFIVPAFETHANVMEEAASALDHQERAQLIKLLKKLGNQT